MRIGVCEKDDAAMKRLIGWLDQYSRVCGLSPEIAGFRRVDDVCDAMKLRRFDVIYVSGDGSEGFLSVRRIREMDKSVRLILISDTDRYALNSIRLHVTDYIVKPIEFKHVVRSLRLAGLG